VRERAAGLLAVSPIIPVFPIAQLTGYPLA
jgi:hypothetical protein